MNEKRNMQEIYNIRRKARKRMQYEIDLYGNIKATKLGRKQRKSILWHDSAEQMRLVKMSSLLSKKASKMTKDDIRILNAYAQSPDYADYQDKGIRLLEAIKDKSNVNREYADKVIEKVRELSPEEYNQLYYQERIFNKLIHAYNKFNNIVDQEELEAYEVEIASDFMSIFDNLDLIIGNIKNGT